MKDRPKFRIWDKKENKWHEPIFEAYAGRLHDLFIGTTGELFAHTMKGVEHESLWPNRYEVVMFTGLCDKKGREIYEGDIISNGYGVGVIFWDNTSCAFKIRWHKTVLDSDVSWIPFKGMKHNEVIDNIYENLNY